MKSLWSEFKAFAFKGNMIDLAVAVVIGAAFSTVINSLVSDVIMPSISYVTTAARSASAAAADAAEAARAHVGLAATKPGDTQPGATQPAAAAPVAPPVAPPAAAPAKPADDKPVNIEWTVGRIRIGNFIGALLNFIIVAAAVFLIIVKLLGSVMKRVGGTPAPSEPTTKECPECLSVIPLKARRCPNCTSELTAAAG